MSNFEDEFSEDELEVPTKYAPEPKNNGRDSNVEQEDANDPE
jgi:hypothetical protein